MSTTAAVIELIGRVLFALQFLVTGVLHFRMPTTMLRDYAKSVGFPVPVLTTWPTGVGLLVIGTALALGILPDIATLMAAAFVTTAASFYHRFWTIEDAGERQAQTLYFLRNVALLGASLALFTFYTTTQGEGLFLILDPVIKL